MLITIEDQSGSVGSQLIVSGGNGATVRVAFDNREEGRSLNYIEFIIKDESTCRLRNFPQGIAIIPESHNAIRVDRNVS